ncbi:MAG TPA: hypothetical protein VGS06_36170, partial [Streptosporangiaceae bacterium]|nr:hypothetical protein [Streptosporangiaceae bacterium]
VGAEKQAAVSAGSGDSFAYGTGAAGIGGGVSQISDPVLVQSIQVQSPSGTSVAVTLGTPTTAGNCLVFCVTTNGGTGATVTGITLTLSGSADHFAVAKATQNGTSVDCEIWTDANCAGGQIFFTVTLSGTAACTIQATEWSGLTTSPVDKTASSTGTSAAFTTGATAALAQTSEVVIGAVAVSGSNTFITGPANWGNLPQQNAGTPTPVFSLDSYVRVSSTAAQTYQGVCTSSAWAAAVVTLKTVAASIPSPSPPASATATGDTPGQRIERILGYGGIAVPMRAVDPATLPLHAATDVAGQQAGASVTNVVQSDSGWWFTDSVGVLNYRSRPHLNADTPAWNIGMNTAGGYQPFAPDVTYDNDPQRVFTVITVKPFSPDGSTPAALTPAAFTAVNAAQAQYGTRPLDVTSYLQSAAEQQVHVNWLFTFYGTLRKRAAQLTVDAASHPAAWGLVLGANISDLIQVYDAPAGAPASTTVYRISSISRSLSFGANGQPVEAKITISADPVPPSPGYWS